MAKKISIEEYEKSKKKEEIIKPEQKNKLLLPLEILIVLFGCSLICIIILLFNNSKVSLSKDDEIYNLKSDLNSQEELTESYKEDLERLIGDHDVDYIEKKLDFFDESVVYVVDDKLGNYYYSYDCLVKKIGNKQFSYLAYNPENARAEGYKKGKC
jgi:hypothetical protein